ncbi:MAG: putative RNA methyltransferase [Ilumatobacteraceae bacterium]
MMSIRGEAPDDAVSIFCCPHCGAPFSPTPSGVTCPNGHSFDRAREGYLHLLPSGRLPGSTTPGDTAESLQARRRFLHAGWYSPIAHALSDALGTVDGALLDVGCGEGWYLGQIAAHHRFGLDISKRAVQMASKYLPDAQFVVGNSFRLPVLTQSCGAVFTVFAPHSHSEYHRILQSGGTWVTVTPGPRHLEEMRPKKDDAIIQREAKRADPPVEAQESERVTFTLALTNEAAQDLFTMTPLQWQTAADASPVTEVTADVWISRGTTL